MADGGFPRPGTKTRDPKMIGMWKMGREIGRGASGRVRIARHSKTGQYAAVKIVSKQFIVSSRMSLHDIGEDADRILRDLEREIVVMKLIEHPNIMRLYDVWETSSDLYLILEYVEGGELFDYLCDKGRLETPEASRLFQQIISAMHYCHQVNIAHRDLKPENILLDKDKNIRVADFGMAAAWYGQEQLLETACGSPHYAAPEVINQLAYDGSLSDIWSCGVILFALVSGRLPFNDEDSGRVLEAVRAGKYEMPTDIDPHAQDLIAKMLVYDPQQRISIPDILKHPFCTSEPLPKSLTHMPKIEFPETPISDVDSAIFANMVALWPTIGSDTLTANLTCKGSTWEKGVYRLLLRYRARHLEEYDEEEENRIAQRRKSRRDAKKTRSQQHRRKRSVDFLDLPPRDGPPTPRRASRRQGTSDSRSSSPSPDGIQPVSLFSRALLNVPQSSAATTPTSSKADSAPEVQDVQLQTFLKQIAETLNVIQHTPKTPADVLSPNAIDHSPLQEALGGLQPSRNVNTTRPLSIRRRATDKENSSNTTSYLTPDHAYRTRYADDETPIRKSSLRTKDSVSSNRARADLRVQIREPAKLRKRNSPFASPASSAFSFSDAGSSIRAPSPKRSWLNNIFGFRPPSYQLLSAEDIHVSRLECKVILEEMGLGVVLTQAEGMGVLKCRLDESRDPEGLMPTIKAVKFRVEMQRPTTVQAIGGSRAVLTWVIEKGAQSSFRLMFNRFRKEWNLDTPHAVGTSMRVSRDSSPILPQDERFVEVAFDG
ncbi:hypothetical protein QCA50_010459 [Cerrena zonata]|uniref:non-specific serine/threonine protein kinase n=1 Tax=Cerrena zonata TaxID=2478898 RepID=A0AAW0G4G0_9APHY